jgi:hypothetical protein
MDGKCDPERLRLTLHHLRRQLEQDADIHRLTAERN